MLDELSSGVSTAGAPDIERTFELAHASTAAVIFLIPGAIAFVIEPIVFLMSDRYPRRWFVIGGLAVMALGAFACALAPSAITLALAITVWGIASGSAASLAQATLVDRDPDRRARTLARWSMAALAGDFVAPIALAAFAAVGLSWRASFVLVGIALAILTIAAAMAEFPKPAPRDPDEPPAWRALWSALRDRSFVCWMFGLVLCDLLDAGTWVALALLVIQPLGLAALAATELPRKRNNPH